MQKTVDGSQSMACRVLSVRKGLNTSGIACQISQFTLGVVLLVMTVHTTFAQTADDEMAMRWWNTLSSEQMVTSLYGDSANSKQKAAAMRMYARLGNMTKMLVNDTAASLYGEGRFTSVGEWWETLNCQSKRIAVGDGNTHDPDTAFCAHYPDSGADKILSDAAKLHVDVVGMALLHREEPGELLPSLDAMATRWWNALNGEQMVAALYGDDATDEQAAAAMMMYADLDDTTKMLVDDATREIYGFGMHASVGSWWETLDCRLRRIAAGDGSEADSHSPYCAHYHGSGASEILGESQMMHVDHVGMALLRRSSPGDFPTPHAHYAHGWWDALSGEQMVAALFGDAATMNQETSAKKIYVDLDHNTRKLVNDASAALYGSGDYASIGGWWETLDCRLKRIATGDGNTADSNSPYCAHYPGSGLSKILGGTQVMHVNRVGAALLDIHGPGGIYPEIYRVPFFLSASDVHMRTSLVRIINRGSRSVDVTVSATDDTGREYGPTTLSVEAHAAVQLDSTDLEFGNMDKGLSGGIGTGTGDWRVMFESTLPLRVLSYVQGRDGLVSSMNDTVPQHEGGYTVPFMTPGDDLKQSSWLRITNPSAEMADVRIEALDDEGYARGSAVEFSVKPNASLKVSSEQLQQGGEGLMGAFGDGDGSWRLHITNITPAHGQSSGHADSDDVHDHDDHDGHDDHDDPHSGEGDEHSDEELAHEHLEILSIVESPSGSLSNLSTSGSSAMQSSDSMH